MEEGLRMIGSGRIALGRGQIHRPLLCVGASSMRPPAQLQDSAERGRLPPELMLKPYLEMLTEAFSVGRLPESQREVVIVVLHKKGRVPLDVRLQPQLIVLTLAHLRHKKKCRKSLALCKIWQKLEGG
ncbi:hypothetical protein NDU88_007835 [Pleurodeles waltl]|uniref:Uncharacterized protein n=1 Tax=Pleurodeles waltl TaxID=8319 RepID=A0AAV7PQF0_PLEWA|nr:hypothetical protein NDU88_007835 [Pleurodeles waltl]